MIGTLYGVPILRIKKILDWFKNKGYNPENKEFEEHLERGFL